MTIDGFKQLVADIRDKFQVKAEDEWFEEEAGGTQFQAIEFESSLGLTRLELMVKPKVIDRQTKYSNRIGAETEIIYTYSPTEKVCQLSVWLWDESADDWREIDPQRLNFND